MNDTTTSTASVLNQLIETCKDGQEGFRAAAEDVKSADLKSLFSELSLQRGQFVTQLQTLVASLGLEPEKGGSISGAIHRGWIDLKSAISSGDEHSILAECERGEDSAVDSYRDALKENALPPDIASTVRHQAEAVQAAHDRVRDLRDRFQK